VNTGHKEKPLTWREGLRKLINTMHYQALSLVLVPFGAAFWRIEKAKSRLQDQRANERWDT
jgi:hypothetical protein